ncbi:MFS transporter [Salinisphaera sp.]|uniref:MFS transporter n=1 Tax=Salinisphaera sp. TaxID=1914330 RepID=UPI000C580081|nr:MFS transporter [Salinisphaera sp.]MBS61791.1 MFS transporter [Salinisphaera sp.]
MTDASEDSTAVDAGAVRKAVTAAGLGNALEWFDFSIYAYTASTIGHVFFAQGSGDSLLKSLMFFAVAFAVRPLGGLFFGPLGDRLGRSSVLAITIIMMSIGTVAIGLIPTYDSIGIWAPILLLAARLVQGFSTGGEYGGAATFICEYSPDNSRGFLASFLEFGTLGGYILGSLLVFVVQFSLGDEAFTAWGWRIPFLCAAPLGLFGLYLRLKLEDSPAFVNAQKENEANGTLAEVIGDHTRQLLLCIGLTLILNIAYYTVLTYLPSYLETILNISTTEAAGLLIVVQVAMMSIIYLFGGLSDRVGRKPVLIAACLSFIVFSYPAFLLLSTTTVWGLVAGLAMLGLMTVMLAGVMPATLPAIFPTRVRYGGFAIAYNLSTSLFGGTAPLIIQYLIGETGNNFIPAFYLMGAAVIALVPIMLIPETAGRPLPGSKAQHSGTGPRTGPREPAPAA